MDKLLKQREREKERRRKEEKREGKERGEASHCDHYRLEWWLENISPPTWTILWDRLLNCETAPEIQPSFLSLDKTALLKIPAIGLSSAIWHYTQRHILHRTALQTHAMAINNYNNYIII